jgi:hypothetical protein
MSRKRNKVVFMAFSLMTACQPIEDRGDAPEVDQTTMLDEVLAVGREVDGSYWDSFSPATEEQIEKIERELQITLPSDFREFYLRVGWNREALPGGGSIYSPEDLIKECATNIFFVTGSRTKGAEWASLEAHEKLWKSNGSENPDPTKFTGEAMNFHGVPLWHLLDVGFDGIGATINVYTGPADPPFRFCKIHQSELSHTASSFYEGLLKHLREELGEDPEAE